MKVAQVRPEPSDEEMAAIVAALDVIEREAVTAARTTAIADANQWRFSGRWWNRSTPLGRGRP